jgi:recombinational DNA repair ATPase RecF
MKVTNGDIKIQIEHLDFQRMLDLYLSLNKRDMPTLINKTAKDVGLTAAKSLLTNKPQTRTDILKFVDSKNFVKYIAKRVKNKELAPKVRYRKTKDGTKVKAKQKKWNKQISEIAKTIKGKRLRSITLLASAFIKATKSLLGGTLSAANQNLTKAIGWSKPAVQSDKPTCTLGISYNVRNRESAKAKAEPYLQIAMETKRLDLFQYIKRKLFENGKKVESK